MISFEDIISHISYIDYKKANDEDISQVTNDSRKVDQGTIFVAIKGSLSDGHDYITSAIEKGASLIIHTADIKREEGISYIKVADPRKALAQISNLIYDFPSRKMDLVAVTGSNGKTTTSRLISFLMGEIFGESASIGTNNAVVGDELIPTSNTTPDITEVNRILAKCLDKNIHHLALEASSHGLDQKRLYGLDISYGLFTNLSEEHLDYHKTMDNYFKAKMILFENAKTTIANIDDPYGKKAKELFPNTVTFAIDEKNADYRAEDIRKEDGKISFKIKGCEFIIKKIANYEIYNTLAACACLNQMGASMEEIAAAFKRFKGVKSRFEYIENDLGINIILDFAHTPRAYEALFESVPKGAKKIAVFGINGDRNANFRRLIGNACGKFDTFAVLTTDDPKFDDIDHINEEIIVGLDDYKQAYVIKKDRTDAMEYAFRKAKPGDYVFLLGKGEENFMKYHGNEKTPYSERETIKKALARI